MGIKVKGRTIFNDPYIWENTLKYFLLIPIPNVDKIGPCISGLMIMIIGVSLLTGISGYIAIIIGLIIDIFGAVIIISPLLTKFRQSISERQIEEYWPEEPPFYFSKTIAGWKEEKKGHVGLLLLITGFLLQIFGNALQYLEH